MEESPAKRRRIASPTESSKDQNVPLTTPTSRRRASYASPTKSSLQRSHPHLLDRTSRQSTTEPRGRALRNQILGPKNSTTETQPLLLQDIEKVVASNDPPLSTLEDVAPDSHADLSSTPKQTEQTELPERPQVPTGPRQPLHERQSLRRSRPARDKSQDPIPHVLPKPKLVQKAVPRTQSRPASNEPELPPTPVQLGLSPAPDRPRGLASSSSPGGSGSRRRRRRSNGPVTSSPLKQKAQRPSILHERNLDEVQPEPEVVNEAPESEASGLPVEHDQRDGEDESNDLEEKQASLEALRKEVEALRERREKLEDAVTKAGKRDLDSEFLQLLKEDGDGDDEGEEAGATKYRDIYDLGPHAEAYLTLFSPGNLQLSSKTETQMTRRKGGALKALHIVDVRAPAPWPAHVLSYTVLITVDAADARVEDVKCRGSPRSVRATKACQVGVNQWINDRLGHPLHKLDVGGLVWGIGQYFKTCVDRATALWHLDQRYNKDQSPDSDKQDLTAERAIQLAKYLNQTSITLTKVARAKGIMLTWEVELDWTGSCRSRTDISINGVSRAVEKSVKGMFNTFLPTVGAIKAVDAICDVLKSEDGGKTTKDTDFKKRKLGVTDFEDDDE